MVEGEEEDAAVQGIMCGDCRGAAAAAMEEEGEEGVGGVEGVVNGVAHVPVHVTRATALCCWRFLEEGMGAAAHATAEARLARVYPRFSAVLMVACTEMARLGRPGGVVSLHWRIHNRKARPLTYLATGDCPSYADTYSV